MTLTDIEMADRLDYALAPSNLSAEVFEQMMDDATKKAKILTKVIQSQSDKYIVRAAGQEFLRYEAWSTLAQGYGWTAGVETITDVLDTDGHTVIGIEAYAVLRDSAGIQIGGAPARCMFDEPNWSGKPLAQVASMAGTRAASKALRIGLSWVVVLAGYNPTPAEEFERDANGEIVVAGRQSSTPTPRKRAESPNRGVVADTVASESDEDLICPIHGVDFFKRGKMKSHAHPMKDIDGSGDWCNRHDVQAISPAPAPAPPQIPTPVEAPEPPITEDPNPGGDEDGETADETVGETDDGPDVILVAANEDEPADLDYRALAAELGIEWEDFISNIIPTDTIETFISIGGTLDIAKKRIASMRKGK